MKVCIDPGHGGSDHGAEKGDLIEKDINLMMSRELLESLPYWVEAWPTRRHDEDLGLLERGRRAADAEIAVVLHVNAHTHPKIHGLEVYYWPGNVPARRMATLLAGQAPEQLQRARVIDANDERGTWIQRPQNVLAAYSCTAILVECGYSTNDDDREYLLTKEGRSTVVSAVRSMIVQAPPILKRFEYL